MEIVDLSETQDDPIRQAILASRDVDPGDRLRRVIVVTEWQDSAGARWVSGMSDCSPWEGEGLLRFALRQGLHFSDENIEDAEDED